MLLGPADGPRGHRRLSNHPTPAPPSRPRPTMPACSRGTSWSFATDVSSTSPGFGRLVDRVQLVAQGNQLVAQRQNFVRVVWLCRHIGEVSLCGNYQRVQYRRLPGVFGDCPLPSDRQSGPSNVFGQSLRPRRIRRAKRQRQHFGRLDNPDLSRGRSSSGRTRLPSACDTRCNTSSERGIAVSVCKSTVVFPPRPANAPATAAAESSPPQRRASADFRPERAPSKPPTAQIRMMPSRLKRRRRLDRCPRSGRHPGHCPSHRAMPRTAIVCHCGRPRSLFGARTADHVAGQPRARAVRRNTGPSPLAPRRRRGRQST